MNAMISQAIADGRVLSFSYKGELRTVEPHTYGRKGDGRDSLCGWQTDGGSGYNFRNYFVDEMSGVAIDSEFFDGPRPGYKRGDSRFSCIYAEL